MKDFLIGVAVVDGLAAAIILGIVLGRFITGVW